MRNTVEAIRPFYRFCFEQNMLTLLSTKTFLSQMSHFLLPKRKLRVTVPKSVEMGNECVMKTHKYSSTFAVLVIVSNCRSTEGIL